MKMETINDKEMGQDCGFTRVNDNDNDVEK